MSLVLVAAYVVALCGGLFLFRRVQFKKDFLYDYSGAKVSVVIPVRNEEKNLPRLLASFSDNSMFSIQLIVVDDGSTDRSVQIAEQYGAQVVRCQELPAGWTGKNWACWQGAGIAQGEILIFLDADVYWCKEGLKRLISLFTRMPNPGALSILPDHHIEQKYEYLSAFFNLLMAVGTVGSGRLSGQSLVIHKKNYDLTGGHSSVKDAVLETFFYSDVLHQFGLSTQTILGRGILRMRMYPEGYQSLIEGWMKAFSRGSVAMTFPQWVALIAWFSGLFLAVYYPIFGVGYLFFAANISILLCRIGNFSVWSGIFYPVWLGFFVSIYLASAIRTHTGLVSHWKGRTIKNGTAE